ncbi:MAG: UDP-N-acetylmuramoyl-tripeptide--D-alanyl-D-alanine ligase [Candidatus Cryptobacteroides sp.]
MDTEKLYSIFLSSKGVTTDSRSVSGGELFFALKGENFDGNEYALRALELGACCAVVAEDSEAAKSGDPRVFPVPDTLAALQELALHHRRTVRVDGRPLTVLGLTGTNGKTTTKELITRVLSKKYRVTSTKGNLNNDIGVPLTLLSIDSETRLAVVEMGANHPDDIFKLVRVCLPDYGLITNVGKAHLLGFGSIEGVKAAKGCLYDFLDSRDGTIFLNADDPVLEEMAARRANLEVIRYGVDYWDAIVLPSDGDHPYLRMAVPQTVGGEGDSSCLFGLETRLSGAYNASNVCAAIAVGLHFGVSLDDAVAAIEEYVPSNNRSQMERTERNILIKDAYNANPTSMAAALDNLASVVAPSKAALLGDMRELGTESLREHAAVIERLRGMELGLVCLVGEEFGKALEETGSPDGFRWFDTSENLALWLADNPLRDATVLVKGSRGTMMEKVIPSL